MSQKKPSKRASETTSPQAAPKDLKSGYYVGMAHNPTPGWTSDVDKAARKAGAIIERIEKRAREAEYDRHR